MASHLGFATRVPRDVDLFISGYHADQMIGSVVEGLTSADVLKVDDADPGRVEKDLRGAISYAGDEAFLFVGPGAGKQLQMVGKSYRDLTSTWVGFALGSILDVIATKNSNPVPMLEDELPGELLEKWLEVLEKDSRLQVPGVVIGWKPSPEKQAECAQAVAKGLEGLFASHAGANPVSFEASGVALAGYEMTGREVFGEAIAEARRKLMEQDGADKLLKQLSPERVERLLAAMENVHFTLAAGVAEGRVLIYFGNGKEGFHLAETPGESLAATDDLKWTGEFANRRIIGSAYLSEALVQAALPWLDTSDYWNSLARAIRPPVKDERLLRDLLTGLADTDHELAKRDVSAWSAVLCTDNGLRFESRGGWPDPSLDYETPLRMTDAALAAHPAIRAQWVQNRGRNDLAWKRLEYFGVLMDSVISEFQASGNPMMSMIPEGTMPRVMKEVREINRAYREEFRAGIGDEVALVVDFQGEVPPIPGISQETVKNARAPRFVIARPVRDRALLDAAGKSYGKSWRDITAWASELSGSNIPLVLPQSVESDGLVTWYPPLPFIGGDFVPGVTMNDELWMIGTSKSMARDFAKYAKNPGGGGETGMIVEIDLAPVREWGADLYRRNEEEAEALTAGAPDDLGRLASEQNLARLKSATGRLTGIGYRKWMAGGKPRTSLDFRFSSP
ncbi:MAG: hypothetical protein V4819_15580 [Verrucomicrobiota bacterium]